MATTEEPHYERWMHRKAIGELATLPDAETETLKAKLRDASTHRHPLEHESVVPLDGKRGLYRIRVGDYRAIIDKQMSKLRLLLVDKRSKVYQRLPEAKKRSMHE